MPQEPVSISRGKPRLKHPDARALDAIARELDGVEWDADTLDAIAAIIRATGRQVRDIEDPTL